MGLQEFDHVGRISKQAMLGSTIALFALAISAACVRFYIRIGIQKQFAIDDALLLFGILCIAASVGLLFNYIDDLFLVEALEYGDPALLAELPKDWIEDVYHYQERSAIGLMCAWAAIASVKFSFLFFFKRLIDRIQSMTRYWWAVFILNLAIAGYGFAIYILACPHFNSPEIFKCNEGSAVGRVIDYAISQMVLDIFTDLTILVIPIRIVWQIKIRWAQKLALGSSLCLTIVMIALTIIRVSGLRHGSGVDSGWEVYWLITAGECGIILTTGTAFRTFFVSRNQNQFAAGSPNGNNKLSTKTRNLLRLLVTPKRWTTRRSKSTTNSSDYVDMDGMPLDQMGELPDIEGGTITGIRTFIDARGRTRNGSRLGASQIMKSRVTEEQEDWVPGEQQKSINVRHQIWSTSEIAGSQESQTQLRGHHDEVQI